MNGESIVNSMDSMDINEIVALRKLATKHIKKLRKDKTKKIQTFIPATKHFDLVKAQNWAYEQGLIDKNTLYGFSKFAILNTIDMIIKQIIIEENQKRILEETMNNQNQPNIPQDYNIPVFPEPDADDPINNI